MYHQGTANWPFSFVLARRADRNVLIDTGFMQDDYRSGFPLKCQIPDRLARREFVPFGRYIPSTR